MMKMMMPEKMVVVYGEEGVLTYMDGGMMGDMMGKVVVNTKTGESFVIKDAEKAVYVIEKEDSGRSRRGSSCKSGRSGRRKYGSIRI